MELDILISILSCVCYHCCQIAESTNEDHISQLSKRGKKLTFFQTCCEFLNITNWLGIAVHACDTSTQEAEMGGLAVPDQPQPYSETLPSKEFAKGLQSEILNTDRRLSELVSIDFSRITSN